MANIQKIQQLVSFHCNYNAAQFTFKSNCLVWFEPIYVFKTKKKTILLKPITQAVLSMAEGGPWRRYSGLWH